MMHVGRYILSSEGLKVSDIDIVALGVFVALRIFSSFTFAAVIFMLALLFASCTTPASAA